MSRPENEICSYCDADATTSDHIPPKLLFKKPRPALITVPSCLHCNNSASKDDEYFRLVLTFEHKAGNHPDASALLDTVFRSLKKPQKAGFQKYVVQSLTELDVHSKDGDFLGTAGGYDVDHVRLDKVIERITRGMFRHTTGRKLACSKAIHAMTTKGIEATPDKLIVIKNALSLCGEWKEIEGGAFKWKHSPIPAENDSSIWFYLFYEAVVFIAII